MSDAKFKLKKAQLDNFEKQGYLILKNWLVDESLEAMQKLAYHQLKNPSEPWELEAELGYPGSPSSTHHVGGDTPRRLLGAYQREKLWREYATGEPLKSCLQQLFNHSDIYLSQAHHNCLMTKSPRYSSDTGWHQDSRYWCFEKTELITAWLALGTEKSSNGSLCVIPGSHRMELMAEQFDERAFFIAKQAKNIQLIQQARTLELSAGDLLLFHCNLLHSASRNYTDFTRLSLVFTYHSGNNSPIVGSRSASKPEIRL